MNTREKRRLVELLTRIHSDASMDSSSFSHLFAEPGDALPKTEAEVTDFIRKRTRLWRSSWILSPLEEALDILNTTGAKKL